MNMLLFTLLFLLAYPLFVYPPLLAAVCARKRQRPSEKRPRQPENPALPAVSVLLAAYNEENNIRAKIENFLALEYPRELLELIVVSDASTDATDAIVSTFAGFAAPCVRLLRQRERLGKTSALNRAAIEARGEILFFTDADAMLHPDCLRRLLSAFETPEVGLASGRSRYLDATGGETPGSLYRRFEEWLKEKEGRLFGIAGADGAVYALRKELYSPLTPEYINDLVHPAQVALAGKKSVAVPEALVTEPAPAGSHTAELARQTRIMAQSWLICLRFFGPLWRAGQLGFLWQLISHKVLRWLFLPLLLCSALLACFLPGGLAALTLAGCSVLVLLTCAGALGLGGTPGKAAWLFMLQGAAAMRGLISVCRGNFFVTWQPRGQ